MVNKATMSMSREGYEPFVGEARAVRKNYDDVENVLDFTPTPCCTVLADPAQELDDAGSEMHLERQRIWKRLPALAAVLVVTSVIAACVVPRSHVSDGEGHSSSVIQLQAQAQESGVVPAVTTRAMAVPIQAANAPPPPKSSGLVTTTPPPDRCLFDVTAKYAESDYECVIMNTCTYDISVSFPNVPHCAVESRNFWLGGSMEVFTACHCRFLAAARVVPAGPQPVTPAPPAAGPPPGPPLLWKKTPSAECMCKDKNDDACSCKNIQDYSTCMAKSSCTWELPPAPGCFCTHWGKTRKNQQLTTRDDCEAHVDCSWKNDVINPESSSEGCICNEAGRTQDGGACACHAIRVKEHCDPSAYCEWQMPKPLMTESCVCNEHGRKKHNKTEGLPHSVDGAEEGDTCNCNFGTAPACMQDSWHNGQCQWVHGIMSGAPVFLKSAHTGRYVDVNDSGIMGARYVTKSTRGAIRITKIAGTGVICSGDEVFLTLDKTGVMILFGAHSLLRLGPGMPLSDLHTRFVITKGGHGAKLGDPILPGDKVYFDTEFDNTSMDVQGVSDHESAVKCRFKEHLVWQSFLISV